MCHTVGLYWTMAVNELRAFWQTNERDPSDAEMYRLCKDQARALGLAVHSQQAQVVVHDLFESVASTVEP
jgi:hypothetical protein